MDTVGPDAVLTLPALSMSVGAARRTVTALCAPAGLADVADTAALLTSEVVTNAVVHGDGTVHVRARVADGRLRVEVQDDGAGLPRQREADAEAEGGRGMALVAMLSSAWGVEPRGTGKVVWFELVRA